MGAIRAHLHTPCPRSLPGLLAASSPLASRPVLGGGRPSRDDAGGRRRGGSASPPVTGGGGTGDWRGVLRRLSPVASLDAQDGVQADAYFHIAYHQERRFGNHREERLAVKHFSVEGHIAENKEDNGRCIVSPILRIKSFTELPVLLDDHSWKGNKCEGCRSPQLLSNTPHFFTIVLDWLCSSESQDTLSEVLAGITSPIDIGFFCKSADSSTMYTVTSMTEDTLEHLLERFKDCKLQPEGLQAFIRIFHKLDAGSPQTTKIKSFAELLTHHSTNSVQMSSKCRKCPGEYPYSAVFHKLDAGSPQAAKIKSFAELPVLLDEQFCKDNNCEDRDLHWLSTSQSQDTLCEVLAGITSPVDTGFFCKSADSSTMYTVTSMICCVDESYVSFVRDDKDKWLIYGFETAEACCKICCADESYVCFARDDKDKWLIYGFETVKTEDTWEHLLERFKDCKLQPEVLFFEVIK